MSQIPKTWSGPNLAICVAGVPGVGKTKTLSMLVGRRPNAEHLTGSSVLRCVIAPATTQEFDQWPAQRRDHARGLAIERLCQLRAACAGLLLVDGHFSLRERGTGRLHRVFTRADIDFYDALVLLDAPTEQILDWRGGDSRARTPESPGEIEAHRQFERAQALELADAMSVPFVIIEELTLDDRIAAMNSFLDELGGCS